MVEGKGNRSRCCEMVEMPLCGALRRSDRARRDKIVKKNCLYRHSSQERVGF